MENSNIRPASLARITTPALAEAFISEQVAALRKQIGDRKVLLALSGGVDSSVVAALLIKAVGQQLVCVHVNHGLLRKGEPEQVVQVFRHEMNANLVYVDATDRFLNKLAGVSDPTRPGYTFLNWMYGSRPVADNDTYSGLVQSDAVASATLTAAWQLIPYTITYDLDGGTADGNPTGYSVESAAITLVNPTREGYDFTGWSGTGLTGTDNLTVVIPAGSTGDRSYTAHWAKQHVHVFDQQMILPQALKTPADCTHDAVYYLSCVCGLVSTDDNQVFTAVGTALGHDWGQPRWQWTGFAAQAVFACSRDAGHVETLTADVASEVTTAPGCVTDGVRTYTATVTLEGRTYTDTKTESIPATGHDTELKNARAATCTEVGYTGDEVCRTCGETIRQGTVIPATGHDFQDGKCVNCGAADPDYRPAKPENPGVKTGDAGVLLYAGLMLLTLTGSAWVLGRKRTR